MTEEQKRAAFNAVMSALITIGATDRDAMYAAEAAVQNLTKWNARFIDASVQSTALAQARGLQRRIDAEDRDLAHEADMRELRRKQLLADVGDDAEAYMGDPDEWDGQ